MATSVDPAKLRQARLAKGFRKEQVSVNTGLSYSAITAYESGTIEPRAKKLLTLAALYDVLVEDLCSELPSRRP